MGEAPLYVLKGGSAHLDWMARELKRYASRISDAVAEAAGERDVDAVAWGEVGSSLCDADDRTAALQLLAGEAVVEVTLQVERGHPWVGWVVEPFLAAQPGAARGRRPWCSRRAFGRAARSEPTTHRLATADQPRTAAHVHLHLAKRRFWAEVGTLFS